MTADKPLTDAGIARTALENDGVEADATTPKAAARKVGKPLDHHSRRGVVIGSDVGGRKPGWFVSP